MVGRKKKKQTPDPVPQQAAIAEVDKLLPLVPSPLAVHEHKRTTIPHSMQQLARDFSETAFATILEIMEDRDAEPSTRLEAAKVVLDRGWGKATVNINQQTINVQATLQDIETKLLERKAEVDAKWAEAARIESEQLGRYIAADVEVIEDTATYGGESLQDSAQGSGNSKPGLVANSDAYPLPDTSASREAIYGAFSDSEAEANLRNYGFERDGVQVIE